MAGPDPETETIGAYRHLALGDVGSTNTECLSRAANGDRGRLWITAERQLEGRGRRGRPWVSEPGNLYASLLLIDPAPAAKLGSLPLVAAVAVHRAIEAVLPGGEAGRLRIKWPNDILLGGAKTCGILLESETLADGRRAVVVGCGINIAHAPEPGLYPAVALNAAGAATHPDLVFARLFAAMNEELAIWDGGQGISRTLKAWIDRAAGIGEPISVNLADQTVGGRFAGIDSDGRLVLQRDGGGVMTIAAGDVFFGAAAGRENNS